MTEPTWRPLGLDAEDEVANYDALHDGIPAWMDVGLWEWIREHLTISTRSSFNSSTWNVSLDTDTLEQMCQALRIGMPSFRRNHYGADAISTAVSRLKTANGLQVADYLLAHKRRPNTESLDAILTRSKSAWQVGTRAERPGLTRRVSLGVQTAADDIMDRSSRAGVRLAKAWETLYGLDPNPSEAYLLAIKAVEDAAIPLVSPSDKTATLGKVISQLESQGDWTLPMQREHRAAPSSDVVISMARMLWHGQHDRHGGQPSAPGDVSVSSDEATVAVSIAVTLVHLFTSGLLTRTSQSANAGDAPGT